MMTEEDSSLADLLSQQNGIFHDNYQLCYTGQDCYQIPSVLGENFGRCIHRLDLSYCSLTTLCGLEKFINLEELVLDNNQLGDTITFPFMPNLRTLSINKNKITNLEIFLFNISACAPNLHFLSLLGNVACPNELSAHDKDEEDYQRYRWFVLHHLPKLKFLDSRAVLPNEKTEGQRIGQFMNVVKPILNIEDKDPYEDTTGNQFSPLPDLSSRHEHQGAFGKCRYRYSGKHSEGNRFIRNNDL